VVLLAGFAAGSAAAAAVVALAGAAVEMAGTAVAAGFWETVAAFTAAAGCCCCAGLVLTVNAAALAGAAKTAARAAGIPLIGACLPLLLLLLLPTLLAIFKLLATGRVVSLFAGVAALPRVASRGFWPAAEARGMLFWLLLTFLLLTVPLGP
jgi:hypothetical protein